MESLLLTALLLISHAQPARLTRATRYADTPRDEGGTPACWRRCLEVGPGGRCLRRFPDGVFNAAHPLRVAHRTLPCGTVILLRSRQTGRAAVGVVLDRGPWGRPGSRLGGPRAGDRPLVGAATQRAAISRPGGPPARGSGYRGDLDLSPRVAGALGLTLHVGRMWVDWWVVGLTR